MNEKYTPGPWTKAQIEDMIGRLNECVHHEEGCPSIGGNGDRDCTCGAVATLRDAFPFDLVPCRGQLGFFAPPPDAMTGVVSALRSLTKLEG